MRRTKEDAGKTRAAILESAEILFLQKGVAHTSLEQIAKHAGVTRGAVYWHFKNKADLFHVMLSQVRLPTEQMTERIKLCDPENPVAGLRNLCSDAMAALAHEPRKRRIFTILLRRCEFTDELREAERQHEAFINEFIDLCTALFAEPATAARLRPGISPRMAAISLHSMLLGLLSDWLRDPQLLDAENIRPYLDVLLHGLFRHWDGGSSASCPDHEQGS